MNGAAGVSANLQPEKRLMLAVLEDAVTLCRRPMAGRGRHDRQLLVEVQDWVASDDDSWAFSFVRVCHHLSLDPQAIRKALTVPVAGMPDIARPPFRSNAVRTMIGDQALRQATRITVGAA